MPLPHMAQALKDIIAYLETGDKSHLQEAKKNVEDLEVLIESQKHARTPSKRNSRRK